MHRLLILLAVVILFFYGKDWFLQQYAKQGRPFLVKFVLVTAALILLALAAFGRVHWIGAILASFVAILRFALPFLIKSLPLWLRWRKAKASENTQNTGNTQGKVNLKQEDMDRSRAIATLGLKEPFGRQDILDAHRRMMQNLHPDKGGSDLLAAQVNTAKDYLLASLK